MGALGLFLGLLGSFAAALEAFGPVDSALGAVWGDLRGCLGTLMLGADGPIWPLRAFGANLKGAWAFQQAVDSCELVCTNRDMCVQCQV